MKFQEDGAAGAAVASGSSETAGDRPRHKFWFRLCSTLIDVVKSGAWAGLSGRARAVYPVLWAHANKKWESYPSVATVARLAGVSESTAYDAINDLEAAGLAVIDRRRRGSGRRPKIVGFRVRERQLSRKEPRPDQSVEPLQPEGPDKALSGRPGSLSGAAGSLPGDPEPLSGGPDYQNTYHSYTNQMNRDHSTSRPPHAPVDGDDDLAPFRVEQTTPADLRRVLRWAGVTEPNLTRLTSRFGDVGPFEVLALLASDEARTWENLAAYVWFKLRDYDVREPLIGDQDQADARVVNSGIKRMTDGRARVDFDRLEQVAPHSLPDFPGHLTDEQRLDVLLQTNLGLHADVDPSSQVLAGMRGAFRARLARRFGGASRDYCELFRMGPIHRAVPHLQEAARRRHPSPVRYATDRLRE